MFESRMKKSESQIQRIKGFHGFKIDIYNLWNLRNPLIRDSDRGDGQNRGLHRFKD